MNVFTIEIWYRTGHFDKDFYTVDIKAETEQEAHQMAREMKKLCVQTITKKII